MEGIETTARTAPTAVHEEPIEPAATPPPAAPLLPEPLGAGTVGGDDATALAILWVRSLQQDRSAARELAARSERRIAEANRREVEELKAQAKREYQAACWEAVGEAASGASALAGACFERPAVGESDPGGAISAGGRVAGAAFGVGGAATSQAAANCEAKATEQAQLGDAEAARLEQHRDDQAAAADAMGRTLELLRDLLGAQRAGEAAAVRG